MVQTISLKLYYKLCDIVYETQIADKRLSPSSVRSSDLSLRSQASLAPCPHQIPTSEVTQDFLEIQIFCRHSSSRPRTRPIPARVPIG